MVEKMKSAPKPVAEADAQEVDEMLALIRSRRKAAKMSDESNLTHSSQKFDKPDVDAMLAEIRSRRQAAQREMAATSKPTGEQVLLRDGFFTANQVSGEWQFASNAAPKKRGEYSISVSDLIKSPESLCDWLAHISKENWFDPVKFFAFFRLYRPAP